MKFPECFTERLARLRRQHGLTQSGLERMLQFARGRQSDFEAGKRVPTSAQLAALAHLFGLTCAELLADTDLAHPFPPTPRWARRVPTLPPPWVRPKHTLATRFGSLRRAYPRWVSEAERYFAQNPDAGAWARLFLDLWVDSVLEAALLAATRATTGPSGLARSLLPQRPRDLRRERAERRGPAASVHPLAGPVGLVSPGDPDAGGL